MRKIIIFLFLFTLSSCFMLPVEETVLAPPQVNTIDARTLRTFEVERGDVMNFSNPAAVHVPARTEELRFNITGQRVRGILVSIGDIVQEGDIIAELVMPETVHELNSVQRDFDWAELELRHMQERLALERNNTWFISEVERLTDRLSILEMQLEHVKNRANNRYIFAPFSGVIVDVYPLLTATWSSNDLVAAIIADHSGFLFRVSGSDIEYMQIGQQFDMLVNGEPFVGVVIDPSGHPEAADNSVLLTIVGELPTLMAHNFASVHVIKELAEDVLMVPNLSVKSALDREFVYIIENGIRTLRYVETGLVGNHTTEIISGLEEGEIVVNE